jgi:hypothetical protein
MSNTIRSGDTLPGYVAVLFVPDALGGLHARAAQDLDRPFWGWLASPDESVAVMTRAEFERRFPELLAV